MPDMTAEQIDLLKKTICNGASDDELALFVGTANRMGLDPFAGQIHAVFRNSKDAKGEWSKKMTIQIGISGLRLSADRTGQYVPGRATEFVFDGDGMPTSATAYVMKMSSGTWHECAETAFWDEFAQKGKDGKPTSMWRSKPRLMLAKCAEAMALRRAFPAELANAYLAEEVQENSVTDRIETVSAPSIDAKGAMLLESRSGKGDPVRSSIEEIDEALASGDRSDELKDRIRSVKSKSEKKRLIAIFRGK